MPIPGPNILLIGATGLVGQAVIPLCNPARLTTLARHPRASMPPMHHATFAPSNEWAAMAGSEPPEVLISCLGTTLRQAGSQAAFRAVDHDLLLSVAAAVRRGGTRHMIAVSSVGADAKSRNFYLKTKGEVEDALQALDFERLDLLRPGLLMGERAGPARVGEGIAMMAAPLTDALLHGSLRRYRSIAAETVAKAIASLARTGGSGVHIHENDAIRALAD